MNGKLHVGGDKPAKTAVAVAPVDEETAAKQAAEKAAKGLTIGAVLTAEQARTISHYWEGNLLPYKMADGTQVLIARDQPLPENVKVDAGKKLTAAAQAGAAQGDSINAPLLAAQKSAAFELGHAVKTVVYLKTYAGPSSDQQTWTWMNGTDGGMYDSADAAIAGLGPLPAGTEIIVSQ